MKKILILIVIIGAIFFIFKYIDWWKIGPLGNSYGICEKGYYISSNMPDSGSSYYDPKGNLIGQSCGMYIEGDPVCEAKAKVAGKCQPVNLLEFFFKEKLKL